jgi:hypothetical protein
MGWSHSERQNNNQKCRPQPAALLDLGFVVKSETSKHLYEISQGATKPVKGVALPTQCVSGMIALFTNFSLLFPLFLPLTHTLLLQSSCSHLFLFLIPLLCACVCNIQPTR